MTANRPYLDHYHYFTLLPKVKRHLSGTEWLERIGQPGPKNLSGSFQHFPLLSPAVHFFPMSVFFKSDLYFSSIFLQFIFYGHLNLYFIHFILFGYLKVCYFAYNLCMVQTVSFFEKRIFDRTTVRC